MLKLRRPHNVYLDEIESGPEKGPLKQSISSSLISLENSIYNGSSLHFLELSQNPLELSQAQTNIKLYKAFE